MKKRRPRRIPPSEVVFDNPPLTKRHWLVLAGIVCLLAAATYRAGGMTNKVYGLDVDPIELMDSNHDEFAYCYSRASSPEAREIDILIVGTSGPRDALWHEDELQRVLVEQGGPDKSFLHVMSGDQTFLEALFLLDRIGLQPGQTVILYYSATAFGPTEDMDQRLRYGAFVANPLGFAARFQDRIPRLKEWLAPHERRNITITVQKKMINRIMRNWIGGRFRQVVYGEGPLTYEPWWTANVPVGDLAAQEEHREHVRSCLEFGFDDYSERAYQDLRVLVEFVRARGARIVTMEPPMLKEDEQRTFGPWWERYQAFNDRVREELDVAHADIRHKVRLDASLFYDSRHVGVEARDRWSKAFVVWLRDWFRGAGE